MKKFWSILLTLSLVLTLSVSVFAGEETFQGSTGSGNVGITAGYEAATDNKNAIQNGTEGKVYYLTLSWEQNGNISYNAGKTTYTWNQGQLQYTSSVSDKGWTVTNANVVITATNRSNRDVDVSCGNPVGVSGVTFTGSYAADKPAEFTVGSAATGGFDAVGAVQTKSAQYNITAVSGDGWTGTGNIGTITVTITGK